jgi:hypothetical protein
VCSPRRRSSLSIPMSLSSIGSVGLAATSGLRDGHSARPGLDCRSPNGYVYPRRDRELGRGLVPDLACGARPRTHESILRFGTDRILHSISVCPGQSTVAATCNCYPALELHRGDRPLPAPAVSPWPPPSAALIGDRRSPSRSRRPASTGTLQLRPTVRIGQACI